MAFSIHHYLHYNNNLPVGTESAEAEVIKRGVDRVERGEGAGGSSAKRTLRAEFTVLKV
jgi:hypothetical protein